MPLSTVKQPRLRGGLSLHVVEPDQVLLLDETRQYILQGEPYRVVAPLLDGRRTVEEILESVAGRLEAPQALFAVDQLVRRGFAVEGANDDGITPARAAYWEMHGHHAAQAGARVAKTAVSIEVIGEVREEPVRMALGATGFTIVPPEAASVHVVITDEYLRPELAEVDARHRATRSPWLLAKPKGAVAWIGPVFVPHENACWTCVSHRIEGNRQLERYLARLALDGDRGLVVTSRSDAPAPAGVGAYALATAVEQWAAAGAPPAAFTGAMHTVDCITAAWARHPVVRRPQCPVCGDASLRDPARPVPPVVLAPQPKQFTADGGHRTTRPEATYERLSVHVSPITGVINVLSRLGDGDGLAYSYNAGHNFAQITDDLFFLRRNLRGRSGGKGMTDIQARVSAMCEAVERYDGVFTGDEPRVRASYDAVRDRAIHPRDLLCFSEAQYADRDRWNAAQPDSRQHVVPSPLADDAEIDWSPVWSLSRERELLVPSAYVWYGHPDVKQKFFCTSDANGSAAGNTLEEAILQGLFEVVERDATALWWYNRIHRPGVDLDSFRLPYIQSLREYYRAIDREFWVIDITSDTGIPTFAALSRRIDRPVEDIVFGLGAHLDAQTALLRAITEMNQFLPAVIRRAPNGETDYWFPDTDAVEWWRNARVANETYVVPDPRQPLRTKDSYAGLSTDDIADDVRLTVERLDALGLETFAMEQSRPDIDLKVAKVIVPGMRHFWRRLGPGRLYDVPVTMGWRETPTAEQDMNPYSIFF